MFNKLKQTKMIASVMNVANITTVPKQGSRLELKNERGIFRVSVLRNIMMRLIYNRKYPGIDKKMSDCQMGGRNNIFVLNGIIHEVLKSKKMKPVVFQFYDYAQMFDSINLEEAISDIFDTGVEDENLNLIYNANKVTRSGATVIWSYFVFKLCLNALVVESSYITIHYITLKYITLNYITLYYITFY
eukprot:GFUD01019855.1.p1 GENE.GFUD01019855.1~~GFUD01019855.1.p1  ORF type:complete len:188 (-),score=16.48 GFUD01019855.1:408-971(-)